MVNKLPPPEVIREVIEMLRAIVGSDNADPQQRILAKEILDLLLDGLDKLGRGAREVDRIGLTSDTKALILEGSEQVRKSACLMDGLVDPRHCS